MSFPNKSFQKLRLNIYFSNFAWINFHAMKNIYIFIAFVIFGGFNGIRSQTTIPVHPTLVTTGTYWGITKPLRDLPVMTKDDFRKMKRHARHHELNEGLSHRSYPYAATAYPKGPDPFYQNFMGKQSNSNPPIVNFDGQTSPYFPPDCNGVAGPNDFLQIINTVYAIYDKTGTLLAGPTNVNLIFGNVPGAGENDGDPIVLYDKMADRWLVTEFSIYSSPNHILMAVSTTNDPTGTYYQYSFVVASTPDYPKFGVWQDGYYMGDNNSSSEDTYVFQRSQMLTGGTALMVGFQDPYRPQSISGFMCVPPLTNDGSSLAPAGSPGLYVAFNDDAVGGGSDQLWIYELHVDWTSPASSTFNRTQQLDVEPFSSNFGNNWYNIDQKGTSQRLDAICENIMNVPQYRNFGSYQTLVCCHTVNLGNPPNNNHGGIRWYELRRTTGSNWSIRQQGTYAPDGLSRWLGSIMLNANKKIALGYSVSSTTEHPGIRYCGQSPAEYDSASGIMDISEDTIWVGSYSQSSSNRWGDYSGLCIDPTDDETFWYTNEYIGAGQTRNTRIASFQFITGPLATTMPATDINGISATLNGTVNPRGLSTTYYFEYGTFPLNLSDSTPSDSAGSGNAAINVSAAISNLLSNKTYYFRCVASNVQGISRGSVLNFTTGQPPSLVVNPPNQNVGAPADSTHFTVTSNIDWTVSSDASWCTVTSSGSGNGSITANCSENPSTDPRIANISVNGAGVSPQVVTVSQSGIPLYLNVTPPNRNVTSAPDSTGFTVASNTTWSVSSDTSWCTVTLSGSGYGHITANCGENLTINQRIATITITGTGVTPQIVTVTQSGAAPMLAVSPPNRNVPYTADSTLFLVTSNLNWNVRSDASWCIVSPSGSGNGTIVADFSINTSTQSRVANIQVTAPGVSSQTVTVNQAKSTIGIDEKSSSAFLIYPNPTKGVFRIVPANKNTGDINISVMDPNGQQILKKLFSGETEYLIDLSSAPQGCYYLEIRSASRSQISKLVILK